MIRQTRHEKGFKVIRIRMLESITCEGILSGEGHRSSQRHASVVRRGGVSWNVYMLEVVIHDHGGDRRTDLRFSSFGLDAVQLEPV